MKPKEKNVRYNRMQHFWKTFDKSYSPPPQSKEKIGHDRQFSFVVVTIEKNRLSLTAELGWFIIGNTEWRWRLNAK